MTTLKLTQTLNSGNTANLKDLEEKLEFLSSNIAEEINIDINTKVQTPPILVYGEFAEQVGEYLRKFCDNTIIVAKKYFKDLELYSVCTNREILEQYDFRRFQG